MLDALSNYADRKGLLVNANKSRMMHFRHSVSRPPVLRG